MANQIKKLRSCSALSLNQKTRLNRLLEEWIDVPLERRRAFLANQSIHESDIFEEFKALTAIESGLSPVNEQPAEQMTRTGLVLGSWRLKSRIGQGGMGQVWLAERADGAFQMKAAIKIIHESFQDPVLSLQFERERQFLADLQHPHICRLIDGGTLPNGIPYLVMDYVDGVTLSQWIEAGEQPIRAVLQIVRQACSACAHAHQQHILHCDIKPENMMINSEGELKLLDFGIAKLNTHTRPRRRFREPLTPEYASPEQLRGERATQASDVYSLGLVWLSLLTGQQPSHHSVDPKTRLHNWLRSQKATLSSKKIGKLLGSLLAHQPEDRPSFDTHLVHRLDELIHSVESVPPGNIQPWPRWLHILTILAIVFGLFWIEPLLPHAKPTPKSQNSGENKPSDPIKASLNIFSNHSESLKVLVLPFIKLEDCRASDAKIEQALVEAFRELATETLVPVEIVHLTDQKNPTYEDSRALGTKFKADLVLWGNFYEHCHTAHEIIIKHANMSQVGHNKIHHKNIKLIDIQSNRFKKEIRQYILNSIGHKNFQKGNYRKAIVYWNQMDENNQTINLIRSGNAWRKVGDELKAKKFFRQVLKQPISLFQKGLTYQGLAEYQKAISYYTLALEENPTRISTFANRGNCYLALKRYDLAIQDFTVAIDIDPNYAVALNYRGCAYMDSNQFYKAMADFQKVIDLNGLKRALAHSNQGLIFLKFGLFEAAIDSFTIAIRKNPLFAKAYGYRGAVHLEHQRLDFAELDFQKALSIEPRQASGHWIIAKAHARWGDACLAEAALEQAFQRDMKHYVAFARNEPALERLRQRQSFSRLMTPWIQRWEKAYNPSSSNNSTGSQSPPTKEKPTWK